MAPEDLYPVPQASRFMEDDYLEASDLEAMADAIIERWPELAHIRHVRVRYLWKSDGSGRAQARTTRASGFWRRLADVDVVVWLGAKPMRSQFYTREQVEGSLYHELCHIGWDSEKARVELIDHDAEIFFAEFRRYGVRRRDHARLGQLSLDGHLARGEGLQPARYAYCTSCGEVISVAEGCSTCIALEEAAKQPRPIRALEACRACGEVLDGEPHNCPEDES